MSSQHARIAARAHDLWELRGRPEGSPEIDWCQAEKELQGDASAPEPKATATTTPGGSLPKRARPGRKAAGQHSENGAARE